MASIMDMLADVSYEDNEDSVNEGDEAEDNEKIITESSSKTKDIFLLTDDEDENNDSTNISSFYTAPIVLDKKNTSPAAAVSEVTPKPKPKSSPLKSPLKIQSGDNTESDNNTDGENVTGLDPSQPEASEEDEEDGEEEEEEEEEVVFDPDNLDPEGPKFCHCRWGESGVMVECEKCGEWYHDECIGLTEDETYNIEAYYCAPCCSENSSLVTKYKEDPVKLRQQIIAKIRREQNPRSRPRIRRRSPSSGPDAGPDSDYEPRPAKQRKPPAPRPPRIPKPPRVRAPKPPRTPKPKIVKPKRVRVAKTERKRSPVKKNIILNRSLPSKPNFSSDEDKIASDGDDDVAFVICEECGDSFPHKKALARHYSKNHEEHQTVRYQCDGCDKDFATTKALRDHEIVHSGVKPHSCMFCGDAFYHMSQLTTHTNSKHLNVRHQCDHCSRSYSNKPALSSHMKKAHGEAVESD